jgi:cation-transporting ATPase E
VAQKAKIKGAEKYVDATTLQTDESIAKAMREYTVFGRVTPEQKRKFVKAMQRDGKVVAMTGDGVNDVLALRDADCSVAMASGSEAAAQAAQLVLLESDFARMPDVVAEGRQVVNNLERSGSLFLVKNVFSLITSLVVIMFAVTYPLIPAQISLISMFTIGIPGFLLSQAPNHDLIRGSFVSNILKRATPGGLTDCILVALMVVLGKVFSLSANDTSTACAVLIAAVGMLMVWRASKPVDWYKRACFIACMVGLIFCYIFLSDFFGMSQISIQTAIITGALILASYPLLQSMHKFVDWFWKVGGKFIVRVRDYTHANEIQNPFSKIDEEN